MMKTVYKYPISYNQDSRLDMPKGSQVVAVGQDSEGKPCVWALVNLDELDMEVRQFGIYGTGGRVPEDWNYHGTFFSLPFVWHVFENMRP